MRDLRSIPSAQEAPLDRLIHDLLELLTLSWSFPILSALQEGPMRFNALQKGIKGISQRLLTQRLRELEAAALVTRSTQAESHVSMYDVTKRWSELQPVWTMLRKVLLKWESEDSNPVSRARARSPRN